MIVHEYENHSHRLVDQASGRQGLWVGYEEVARLDEYGAVTYHHQHNLPQVFRVWGLKDEEFQSVYLNLDSDDYWMSARPEPEPPASETTPVPKEGG
jgi:hypothetical protein